MSHVDGRDDLVVGDLAALDVDPVAERAARRLPQAGAGARRSCSAGSKNLASPPLMASMSSLIQHDHLVGDELRLEVAGGDAAEQREQDLGLARGAERLERARR